MPLMPKRIKYRKSQRGRMKGKSSRGNMLFYGDFGLQMVAPGWVTNTQIEAARVAIVHHLKSRGKTWIRVFPDKPVSKKPAETRMEKGKEMFLTGLQWFFRAEFCLKLQAFRTICPWML